MNITSPHCASNAPWLKAALHLHTTSSDGKQPPQDTLDDYARLGFDVVAFTDHNAILNEHAIAPRADVLAIPGCEYRGTGTHPEIGVIGVRAPLPRDIELPEAVAAAAATGAFVAYNHPNWHFDHWPAKQMMACPGGHALEIYNAIIELLPGTADITDKWDILLTCGHRIWGIATDDAHEASHRNHAWTMVQAERTEAAVIAALKAGRFYASSGVTLGSVSLDGGVLRVSSPDATQIRFIADRGAVRSTVAGSEAGYVIREDDIFVRAELIGHAGARAWTNPVFVETERSRELSANFAAWYAQQPLT